MKDVLQIDALYKSYGSLKALNDFSLTVPPGTVYGILGPNGSGKTTLLAILLGVLNKNSGSFKWFGADPTAAARRRIGAILEQPNFYPYLSGRKNLEISALVKNAPKSRIDEVLKIVELDVAANKKFKAYSLGMKQRLAIASALLAEPEVLILDEPTNGLDPQGISDIRQLIKEIAGRGMTILLASHLLDEVEKVCTHVAVLRQGQKVFSGSVNELKPGSMSLELSATDNGLLYQLLGQCELIKSQTIEEAAIVIELSDGVETAQISQWAFDHGIVLNRINERKANLEKQVLDLLKQ